MMSIVDGQLEHPIIEQVKSIIRDRWRYIKCTTRYGWLTAHYQISKIRLDNAECLENLAMKVGPMECKIVIERIRQLSHKIHPIEIPIIAEHLLTEMYTIILFQKRQKGEKWDVKKLISQPPTVFTISNDTIY